MPEGSANAPTNPVLRYLPLRQLSAWARWSRQTMIQLTALLVVLLYSCSVLEVDLGETGDTFGDVYDTYVLSERVQSPTSTATVYRKKLPAATITSLYKSPLTVPADGLFLLAPLLLYIYRPPKQRRLQVLHAIWRL